MKMKRVRFTNPIQPEDTVTMSTSFITNLGLPPNASAPSPLIPLPPGINLNRPFPTPPPSTSSAFKAWPWAGVANGIMAVDVGPHVDIRNLTGTDFEFFVPSQTVGRLIIRTTPYMTRSFQYQFADIVRWIDSEMVGHLTQPPVPPAPVPPKSAYYSGNKLYFNGFGNSQGSPPATCTHSWEVKHLFTSSYEVCTLCKQEKTK